MTADPTLRAMMPDPRFIRDHLPTGLRDDFMREYAQALEAARVQLSYLPLRDVLVAWNKRLILAGKPEVEQELAGLAKALCDGDDSLLTGGVPFDQIRR